MNDAREKTDAAKKIIGLKYELDEGLPQVIVKGSGKTVDDILRKRNLITGPPVVKDQALLEQLYKLPMDAQIGPELFHLVASLLAHVFAVEAKIKGGEA
jgi:flagellar biosynthesis protein